MEKFFKNKKILVTGGAGFIGSHIVDKLVELNAEVTVLDDLSYGKFENITNHSDKIKFIKGSVTDENVLKDALRDIEIINHQAALRSVPDSVDNPLKYHDVNVTGTLKLFAEARKFGIKRIVFASSSAVYGERETFPEKEEDPLNPISPYAANKLICERYGALFSKLYGMEIVALRYFNVFGPRQSLESKYAVVIPKFIAALLAGNSIPIFGDGTQERDFCYIDNVVSANMQSMFMQSFPNEIVNVAEGVSHSVNDLLDCLERITNKKGKKQFLNERCGDVQKTLADITKLKERFNTESYVDFENGLKKTVEWFIEQENISKRQ